MYPTRRAVFFVALGVPLSLLAELIAPQWWLAGAAWGLLGIGFLVLDLALAAIASSVDVEFSLPQTVAVGTQGQATITLRFSGLAPRDVELALDAGPLFHISPPQQKARLRKRLAVATFPLVPQRRGKGTLEQLWIRWRGPLGFCWRQRIADMSQSIPIVPNVQAVKEEAARVFQRRSFMGSHLRMDRGDGAEFHALRQFETGMNRKTIDWKQSARHGALVAKEFQVENNLHIVFALDTGRVMCEPVAGQPRLDRALHSILLMAYAGLRLGDRVGLFAFDERPIVKSGTIAGMAAFPQLQRLASGIDYSTAETNFTLAFTELAGSLEHRSIVVVFTDFADSVEAELMLENVGRLLRRIALQQIVAADVEDHKFRMDARQLALRELKEQALRRLSGDAVIGHVQRRHVCRPNGSARSISVKPTNGIAHKNHRGIAL